MKRIIILCVLIGIAAVSIGAEEASRRKMCWAHYVGWGFNQVDGYDLAMRAPGFWMLAPYGDRSLLGRNIQWDSGIFFGARRQIETALAYGIDGFCVDIVDPSNYVGGLERFFRDAEGTGFKIALCIDRIDYDNAYLIEHLGNFIAAYKEHPNACRIDGKMVIFVYNISGKSIDDWLVVRTGLKSRGLDACYLAQPMRETSMWDDPAVLEDSLRGFDGFYDFGCNGFSPEEMKQRLANGKAALKKHRPDGIFAGGIAVGYIGQGSSFYRPFLNSGTLRWNWEAALANQVDWVCLTTWNDYLESTHFEPSVVNRDNLLLINREYVARWRGETPPARPPRVIYSYHEEVVLGDDLTLEVLNFSYTTSPARAQIRLLDPAGKVLREFAPIALDPNELSVHTIRLNHEEMKDWRVLRVQAAVTKNGESPQWRELYPIVRRSSRTESVRTIRLRQDDLTPPETQLRIRDGEQPIADVTLSGWIFAGKAELLRNGWPVMETEIDHRQKPAWEWSVPLPQQRRSPEDVYVVRVTDVSGRVGFSNPATHRAAGFDGKTRIPVIVTGSDFDGNWPLWRTSHSRLKRPRLVTMEIPDSDLFSIRYDFDEVADDGLLVSSSGWGVPAQLSCNGGHMWWAREDAVPRWTTEPGPDGNKRTVLAFDGGTDVVAVAARSTPTGPFTIELLVKPEPKGSDMMLFADQMGIEFRLDAQLRPQLSRSGHVPASSVQSPTAIPTDRWTHLAAVYDGKSLRIYQDGRKTAESPAPACTNPVNSIPRIGNSLNLDCGFKGQMAGFSLEGAVRTPDDFQLKRQ